MDHFDQCDGTHRKVIAPVQYAPLLGLISTSKFHRYNQISALEQQGDIPVYHPRYLTLPGTNLINVAQAMMRAADKILPDIYPEGETFDLVDGHYLYPDGVAACALAKKHDKPLFLTARGSDVNFWMDQPQPKKDILKAIAYARKVICVSQALKDRLIQHGVPEDKLVVLMNGVDRSLFTPRQTGSPSGDYLLTVGNLVPLKGHRYILQALAALPAEKLVIIGAGELDSELKKLAENLNISDRVTFMPLLPHGDLATYYQNAKCTILMSAMEGMPNVVLESLACGTPVVATNVGGLPEVITPDNGILLPDRTAEDLTAAVEEALNRDWNRSKISQDMSYLDWQVTARKLSDLFSKAI